MNNYNLTIDNVDTPLLMIGIHTVAWCPHQQVNKTVIVHVTRHHSPVHDTK